MLRPRSAGGSTSNRRRSQVWARRRSAQIERSKISGHVHALKELERRAERVHSKYPYLSVAQAFSRVYATPENAHLVARERRQNPAGRRTARGEHAAVKGGHQFCWLCLLSQSSSGAH
jgi:hypothetical protein